MCSSYSVLNVQLPLLGSLNVFSVLPWQDLADCTRKLLSQLHRRLWQGNREEALILWKRRFLTWHFSAVWRRVERDFCELSWLLQINSLSLSLSKTTGVAFEPDKTRVPLHLTSDNWALPPNPSWMRRIQMSPFKSPSNSVLDPQRSKNAEKKNLKSS